MQVWIIVYGQVQSWAPHWILIPLRQSPPNKWVATLWAGLLVSCPVIMASVLLGTTIFGPGGVIAKEVAVITVVLYLFCLIFAINSAVHRCSPLFNCSLFPSQSVFMLRSWASN